MKPTFRFLPAITLVLLLVFALPTPAHAEGIIYGDTVAAGTTLNQDVILIGQEVVIDGNINGNVFILGNQVIINGNVDGSLVLIGQNASLRGHVSGTVYSVALTLELGKNATLARDLYALTVSLTSSKGALVERDLYAIGLDAGLNGQIQRDLHTTIGPIQLYNGLMTLLGFPDLTLKLHIEIPQAETRVPSVGGHVRMLILPLNSTFDWGGWGLGLLRLWAVLFIFTLLSFWLGRKWLDQAASPLRQRLWKALGTGLIVLVICFALFGIELLLAVMIFALGLGLNSLGIWEITIALFLGSYSLLILGGVGLWFFIVYGAKIVAIYTLSTWAFGRLFKRRAVWLDLLALLAGTILFVLLGSIPYVGWIFNILATALGAGSAWFAIQNCRRSAAQPVLALEKPAQSVLPLEKPARIGRTKKTATRK